MSARHSSLDGTSHNIATSVRARVAGAAREAAADNLPEGHRQIHHDHHPDRGAVVEQQAGLVGAGRAGAVGDAAAVLRQALPGAVVCGTLQAAVRANGESKKRR